MTKKKLNNDIVLLKKFSESGNPDYLGELYHNYMHLVYGLCLKYLKEREAAKDAVMQIFEKLITEIPKNEINNFKSWLYVVAKNYCLMLLRSEKTRFEQNKKYQIEQEVFMESAMEMHPIDEDSGDLNKALYDCIEKLKKEQKQCIKLFYIESKCYNEISSLMKLEEKKVKSYLQNGKRNLKICLENTNVQR